MTSYSAAEAYPALPMSADEIPDDLQTLREQWLMEHYRLGHPSQKRQSVLDIDGQTKPNYQSLHAQHA